ncbi:MAG: spore germination protein [Clostridia bacterium]|nr:spore germination protein [Clostridia bacterium]
MAPLTKDYSSVYLTENLDENIKIIKEIFKKDSTLRIRRIKLKDNVNECAIIYIDGMINNEVLNDSVVRPLITAAVDIGEKGKIEEISSKILFVNDANKAKTVADMLRAILYGDTILLVSGSSVALSLNTKGWRTRGISEPQEERVLQGPREGFDEAAMFNLAMLRRKLLTPDLCAEMLRVGRRSETIVFICYLESLADKQCVKELKKKIEKIDIDGILDTNYIAEYIRPHRFSLLKTTGTTERPDVVAARLLEGRIAVIVDGTPVVLTLPYLFSENFQSDEDYYLNFFVASVGRFLRFVCFFLAVSAPAIFVALTTFHKQLLPTSFALSVAQLRGGVPFSALIECLLLIFVFEILKETGLRMPQSLGHALSIVGGLVVGQAAVEARIVSAPMLIAVALSGISGLMIPRLKGVVFYLRVAAVLVSSLLGLYGFIALMSIFVVRVFSIKSFGVDYTASIRNPDFEHLKDTFFRAPWEYMKTRPVFNKNIIRARDEKDED